MIRTFIYLLFFTLLPLLCKASAAEKLTVIYPDVPPPYSKIFEQINLGIKEHSKHEIIHLKLPSQFNPSEVAKSIQTDKVIALGKRGLAIAKKIDKSIPTIVGALPSKIEGLSGISLMAEPKILFSTLKQLAPKVSQISVIYTPKTQWLMEQAKIKAEQFGLTLKQIEVKNIREAVKAYNLLFKQDKLENQAIWLPLDPVTANDRVIVPIILEKAWKNKMVVFSSKPTHAKRGALFSALPNNYALGKQLSKMIDNAEVNQTQTTSTLEKIKLAVNLRTAAHLGYEYNNSDKAGFAMTFPN